MHFVKMRESSRRAMLESSTQTTFSPSGSGKTFFFLNGGKKLSGKNG
jgi:hypothetical protein